MIKAMSQEGKLQSNQCGGGMKDMIQFWGYFVKVTKEL